MGFTRVKYNTNQEDIERLLESLDRPGDYCVHSKLVSPVPLLQVQQVGTVAFPVQEAQIMALIAAAERAPYGKGPETVLDRSVRDCWQIDSSVFQVGGQGWTQSFKTIMADVSDGLGCPSERLEARPYKLLVYEPGGFFTAHRDTEKEVGMIGTLVVSLPTEGAGGELVVRHGDRESVVEMCVSDPSMLSYAAFYADCTHETRPVREGYRVALVFNLVLSGAGASKLWRAPDFAEQAEAISTSLRAWARQAQSGAKIVWLLDHDYSTAGLSFATLKGTDAVVARTLATATERAECSLHAAIVHITEYGSAAYQWYDGDDLDDVEMGEVHDWECGLEGWVAIDDSRPEYSRIPLLDGEMLPDDALVDADPDEKRVEEASGNAGVSVEHVYHMAALVIWPQAKAVQALAKGSISGAIEYVESRLTAIADDASGMDTPRTLGEQLIEAWNEAAAAGWRYNPQGDRLRRMIALLVRIADPGLTMRFLNAVGIRGYSGVENSELVAAAGLVGADSMARFLPEFVAINIPRHPNEVVRLLWELKETYCNAGRGDWREVLSKVTVAALEGLPHAFNPPRENVQSWNLPEPKSLDVQAVCDLFSLTDQFRLESNAAGAVRLISMHPSEVTPDRTIPQALARMRKRNSSLAGSQAYEALWRQATAFLLHRSSSVPEEPRDWFIDAQLGCDCRGCVLLQAFCDDPAISQAKIAVAQSERQHLRDQINRLVLDIDYETERKGRPYRLVCSKNRNSNQRRLAQYADDIHHMNVLIGCLPSSGRDDFRGPELKQLQTASARSS